MDFFCKMLVYNYGINESKQESLQNVVTNGPRSTNVIYWQTISFQKQQY